jgi:cbb3-type cytochrome oxidase subunit 1
MAARFIQIAVIYLVIGGIMGLGMGISSNFSLVPVHAHVLLAGWLSLAMAGVVYHLYPAAATTRLAKAHFWLHNIGLPIFMGALAAMLLSGNQGLTPLVAIGGTTLLVALVLFAANVLLKVRS